MAEPFGEIARRVVRKACDALHMSTVDRFGTIPLAQRQPVELIPGMPAAPEPCQLLHVFDDERCPRQAVAQLKINGIRAIYLKSRIVSRQALPLDCAWHCIPGLARLEERLGEPMVIDGEYVEAEGFEATLAAQKRGIGAGLVFVFDAVPYSEWRANRFTQPLKVRLERLEKAFDGMEEDFIDFLAPQPVLRPSMARAMAAHAWRCGQEGVVVKDLTAPYYRGRSWAWMKLKRRERRIGTYHDHVEKDDRITAVMVEIEGKRHTVKSISDRAMLELRQQGRQTHDGAKVLVSFADRNQAGNLTAGHLEHFLGKDGK